MSSKTSHHHAKVHHNGTDPASSKRSRWFRANKLTILILLIVAAITGGYIYYQDQNPPGKNGGSASLSLTANNKKVPKDHILTTAIWVDTGNQPVNAVQANLYYPNDKFGFVSIDSGGSAFEVEAQAIGGGGVIKIARGHIGSVYGRQLVAKVNLKAKANSGKAKLEFAKGSAVVRSTDNVDILGRTPSATFKLVTISQSPMAANQAFGWYAKLNFNLSK